MSVIEVIEVETGVKVTNETPLDSLPIDSLEFLQLLIELAEVTGKNIPDERIASLRTVGDIARELA